MRLIDLGICLPAVLVAVRTLPLRRSGRPSAAPAIAELHLRVQDGASPARTVTLTGTTTVGSAPTCGLRSRADGVDRHHARIERCGGQWIVADSGSTTGIWVNESPVFAPRPVGRGDVIRVGALSLEVDQLTGAPAAVS